MDDIAKNNPTPNDTRAHRWRVVFFVMIVISIGSIIYWKFNLNNRQNAPSVSSESVEKIELKDKKVPSEFPQDFPIIPGATITKATNFLDHKINEITETKIELESSMAMADVMQYYETNVDQNTYEFLEGSDRDDSSNMMVRVYSSATGMISVKAETNSAGSRITIDFFNILVQSTQSGG